MITEGDVKMPRRATIGSAGYDFFAPDTYELRPNEWTMIDTGVRLEDTDNVQFTTIERIMEYMGTGKHYVGNWFMMLLPKSGLATKYGFQVRSIGIIDMDYRDTIKAMVSVDVPYTLIEGEKFIQGILLPFGVFNDEIEPIEARNGGHGSTGRF